MKKEFKKYLENFQRLLNVYLNNFKKILQAVGKYAFLFILIFVLLGIVFGEFLFYRYVLLLKIKEPIIISSPTKFRDDVYQSVLKEWQIRENIFNDLPQENYSDPFF